MTVATTSAIVTLAGNGVTTNFVYNFIVPFLSDGVTPAAQVWYTDLTGVPVLLTSSQYTFLGAGVAGGGSVIYNPSGTPIATGTYLSIIRAVPYTQPISFPNQSFFPSTIESLGDMIVEQIQQILNAEQFSLQFPTTDPAPPAVLPSAASRKNKLLGFDATGLTALYALSSATGPFSIIVASITFGNSPYTISTANVIFINAASGDTHVNLPNASVIAPLFIIRTDNSSYTVYLDAVGGQTVNGVASYPMVSQNQSVILIPNGSNFWGIF